MAETSPDIAEDGADAGGQDLVLGGRFRLLPDSRLPEFDQPGVTAYGARDVKNPTKLMLARVCDSAIIPRVDSMVQIKSVPEIKVMRPVEWGPVFWPAKQGEVFAVVFERIDASPVMANLSDQITPFSAEQIQRQLLAPGALMLAHLQRRSQTHRAIRTDNIYLGGDGVVTFGDCVSTPPGFGQPALFDTIEMAMTPPHARGPGGMDNDIYSLGVVALLLGLGHCPVHHLSDEEIIRAKIQGGTVSAILNDTPPPSGLREPLRGMLSDDPHDRWGVEEIEQWLSGNLRKTVSPGRELKADRPLTFAGEEHRYPRLLAEAFNTKWREAAITLTEPAFSTWLKRGLNDAVLGESIAEEIEASTGATENSESAARLVARICTMLDPTGPLRYKGITLQPDGLGGALFHAIHERDNDTIKVLADCLSRDVANDWFDFQSVHNNLDFGNYSRAFKRAAQLLKHTGPGYGIERCMYELSPYARCLSEVFAKHNVQSLSHLLPTLESLVKGKGSAPSLVDRHIAAFIATRVKGGIDFKLAAIDAGAVLDAKLGMLGLLAKVQFESGPESVPALTAWMAGEVRQAATRLSSRSAREKVESELERVADSGSLLQLEALLANEKVYSNDEAGMARAAREYANSARKISKLKSQEFLADAQRLGWKLASVASAMISFLTFAALMAW